MAADLDALCDDLVVETAVVDAMVADISDDQWRRPTPADRWSVFDQICHLAFFDDVTRVSFNAPEAQFRALAASLSGMGEDFAEMIADRYRTMPPVVVLNWFRESRRLLVADFRKLDPTRRLPWFGPDMSPASSVTARIMETWAHGQDIADTFGVQRPPSARLRHVAHIGVGARAFSYLTNGMRSPDVPVRVELEAPDGSTWTWGPKEALDKITGSALDFCLLITQRRHRADTDLQVTGDAATEWVSIGQAFAGPPGTGRPPLEHS